MGNEILGDDAELMQAAGGCSISYMLRRATDDPYEATVNRQGVTASSNLFARSTGFESEY